MVPIEGRELADSAISLLFPVVRTSHPYLFESAMRSTPRTRDWRFSSVRSGARPAKAGASIPMNAEKAGSIGIVRTSMPEVGASCSGVGDRAGRGVARRHHHPVDALGPRASLATTATNDESTPPDSPMTSREKPFLVT